MFAFQDKKADLKISTYVDVIIEKVAKRLGVEIPSYTKEMDPTKASPCSLEWTIPSEEVKLLDKQYGKAIRTLSNDRKNKSLNNSCNEELDSFECKSKKLKKEDPAENCDTVDVGNSVTVKQEKSNAE